MAKLDSVIHNFDNHLRSGLCGLIPALYEYSERSGEWVLRIDFLSQPSASFGRKLNAEIAKAIAKLAAILKSETSMRLEDIESVYATIDFLNDEQVTAERRKLNSKMKFWYGYDPVYIFETHILMNEGTARVIKSRDHSWEK